MEPNLDLFTRMAILIGAGPLEECLREERGVVEGEEEGIEDLVGAKEKMLSEYGNNFGN